MTAPTLHIREFQPNTADALAFRTLNEEWITRYFTLEPKDLHALANPEESVLSRGGRIFFAERTTGTQASGEIVACCALLPMGPHEYEVSKMAVTPAAQGEGLGRRILAAVIEAAAAAGANRLYLETNHTLAPALRLYEAAGFRPVPADRLIPSPYARADVYLELFLP